MKAISDRLEALRREMRAEGIDIIIFPSTDPHDSEYPARHWQSRQWISGFTGSAGTAVVTLTEAALWTDSRYFLQAAQQLESTGFQLMKDGLADTPTVMQWMAQKLSAYGGTCVAVDGMVMSFDEVVTMQTQLRKLGGVTVRTNYDAMRMIWKDRPAVPAGEIRVHPVEYAGETVAQKIERLRAVMKAERCQAHVTTDLMSIAWAMNLRGCDVAYTPVFMSFLYVGTDSCYLFASQKSMTADAAAQMKTAGVTVMPYESFADFLHGHKEERVMCDSKTTCFSLYNIIKDNAVDMPSPLVGMKALKNAAEIEGFRQSMLRDGVAMVKFLRWLKPAVEAGGQTEMSISDKLESLRAAHPMFEELSFNTIAGYNAHGAIVHYAVTKESDASLKPEGLILIDSGAQYADGTTDITRTIALGPLTDEMRRAYTLVLKANIALATLQFPDGSSGTQIDAIARSVVWRAGMNYLHGTGHGVGAHLAVHEGPHSIRMNWMPAPLHAGMTVTDEPGLYLEGMFGIRTENTMLIVPGQKTDFGDFLRMEPLTLCPIDMTPVMWDMITEEEHEWLVWYHNRVADRLMPLLDDDADKAWLLSCLEAVKKGKG